MNLLSLGLLVFIFFLPIPSTTPSLFSTKLIVWNVGQGSWATLVEKERCWHFDMGGEKSPLSEVITHCKKKPNIVLISHMDWDHISFVRAASRKFKKFCSLNSSGRFKRWKIKKCDKDLVFSDRVHSIYSPKRAKKLSKNDKSKIYVAGNTLLPGDSTKKMEKFWVGKIPSRSFVKTLILGHHGSKTSTSDRLLAHLPDLRQAIASARYKKYRHPHPTVVKRLTRKGTPVLRTEDWGHIYLEF